MDWEHIARGISTNRTLVSLMVSVDKSSRVYLSTFGKAFSKRNANMMAETSMHTLSALFAGCTFTSEEPVPLSLTACPAIVFILGQPHIGQKSQLNEIIQGLRSQDITATIIMNVFPITPPIDEADKIKCKENRETYLVKDASLIVTYAVLINEDTQENLNASVQALIGLVGSVYDSEHSKMKVYCETGEKALRSFEKLLWGDISWATILPTHEFIAFFQIPPDYGIEVIEKPEIYVPPPTSFRNGINIGQILGAFDEPLYNGSLNPNTTSPHILITGTTGMGKSNLIHHIIDGFFKIGYDIIAYDHHNEYGFNFNLGELGNSTLIFDPRIVPIRLNPFELPPGLSGKERDIAVMETIENFIHIIEKQLGFFVGDVQKPRCEKRLLELYKESDSPRIPELIRLLKEDKTTKLMKDQDNLPIKLSSLEKGLRGEICNHEHTNLPLAFGKQNALFFELEKYPVDIRTFVIIMHLTRWWNKRIASNPDDLRPTVIVLDEFSHLDGVPVVLKLLSESRKYKVILVISLQGIGQIQDRAMRGELSRNTDNKFVFKQRDKEDIDLTLASLGIRGGEWQDYMSKLKVGESIVSLSNVAEPFKILTNIYPENERFSDAVVREKMANYIPHDDNAIDEPKPAEFLNEEKKRFLRLVSENEYPTTNEISDKLGVMRSDCYLIKNQLVNDGLILVESVKTGRGRPSKVLSLSEQGYELLGLEKKKIPTNYGGTEHRMRIQEIAEMLKEAGWEVQTEWNGTDIKASKENKTIAYEIEAGSNINVEQIKTNVLKDIKWGDRVYLVCPNASKKVKIKRVIKDLNVEKVEVLSYSEIERSYK